MKALIILFFCFLAACVQPLYTRPDYTPQLWARDSYECQSGSLRVVGVGGVGWSNTNTVLDRNLYDLCLQGRGWTRER